MSNNELAMAVGAVHSGGARSVLGADSETVTPALVLACIPLTLIVLSFVWTPMVILWFAVAAVPCYLLGFVALCMGVSINTPPSKAH